MKLKCKFRRIRFLFICIYLISVIVAVIGVKAAGKPDSENRSVLYVGHFDWQKSIDEAPAHAELIFDSGQITTLKQTLVVNKPLILRGIHASLPNGLEETPIIEIHARGVTLTDFKLYGNRGTVRMHGRRPLMIIQAGGFHIERGELINSAKDGILLIPFPDSSSIVGGVFRDLVGRDNVVDVISMD
ncbi:hypothetical protein BVY01_02005, partial [bacterium I07]